MHLRALVLALLALAASACQHRQRHPDPHRPFLSVSVDRFRGVRRIESDWLPTKDFQLEYHLRHVDQDSPRSLGASQIYVRFRAGAWLFLEQAFLSGGHRLELHKIDTQVMHQGGIVEDVAITITPAIKERAVGSLYVPIRLYGSRGTRTINVSSEAIRRFAAELPDLKQAEAS